MADPHFGPNLIRNASGELSSEPGNEEWICRNRIDPWIVTLGTFAVKRETGPHSLFPQDSSCEEKCCFVTSHMKTCRHQVVEIPENQRNLGFDIYAWEWVASRGDCGVTRYGLQVELLDNKDRVIASFDSGELNIDARVRPLERRKWDLMGCVFRGFRDVAKVKFQDGGQDEKFWAGFYGPHICECTVRLRNPEARVPALQRYCINHILQHKTVPLDSAGSLPLPAHLVDLITAEAGAQPVRINAEIPWYYDYAPELFPMWRPAYEHLMAELNREVPDFSSLSVQPLLLATQHLGQNHCPSAEGGQNHPQQQQQGDASSLFGEVQSSGANPDSRSVWLLPTLLAGAFTKASAVISPPS
eukprot:GCRY01002254.1.p1 GENE.GCRY01002254.1~~GCRY01002254.1.p1  ORF type:complete len:358 (+),score=49.07 GCRY01002254.1:270-1343(+)